MYDGDLQGKGVPEARSMQEMLETALDIPPEEKFVMCSFCDRQNPCYLEETGKEPPEGFCSSVSLRPESRTRIQRYSEKVQAAKDYAEQNC